MESDDPLDGLFDIDANNNPPLLAQEPYHNFQPFDPSYPEIQPFNDLSTLQLQLQNQNFPYPYQNYGPTIIDSQPQNESFNFPVNHQNFILPFHLPTQYPFSPYPEGPFYPIQPNHFINNFSNQSDRSQLFDTQLFPQSQQFQQPPNPQPPLPQSKTEPKIFKSERLVVQNTIPLETVHYSQTFQFPPKTNRKQTLDQTPKFPDSFEYGPTTIPNSAPFDPLDGVFENNQTQSSRDLIGENQPGKLYPDEINTLYQKCKDEVIQITEKIKKTDGTPVMVKKRKSSGKTTSRKPAVDIYETEDNLTNLSKRTGYKFPL